MSHVTLRAAAPVSVAAALALLVLASCNRSKSDRADAPAKPPKAAARDGGPGDAPSPGVAQAPGGGLTTRPMDDHWMQTPQLKELMQSVAKAANESRPRLPDDPEKPPTSEEVAKAFADAATLAEQLANAAKDIPPAAQWINLSAEERRGFVAEAESLGRYAAQLKEDAAAHKAEAMDRTLTQINATCVTCHTRYRDRSAAPDPFQAKAGSSPMFATVGPAPVR